MKKSRGQRSKEGRAPVRGVKPAHDHVQAKSIRMSDLRITGRGA